MAETSALLSDTAGHLVKNAVPAEAGVPTSFTEKEMSLARILSESAVPVAQAAPVSSLAAPEFAQAVPQSAPT